MPEQEIAKSKIESLGVFYPERVESTESMLKEMAHGVKIDVEGITGIRSRRVCGEDENSFIAALEAAKSCLKSSRYAPENIDIVINCSITRFIKSKSKMYFEPAMSLFLKKELGLTNAIYFDVSNACGGMMTGAQLLDSMIKSGAVKNGLVVSGEHITCVTETAKREVTEGWDPQFGALTVGDSGAAITMDRAVGTEDQIDYIEMMTCAEYSELCIGMPSEKSPYFALYTNNSEMQKDDRVKLWPRFLTDFNQKTGRNLEDEKFDYLIHHQVGIRAVGNFSRVGEEELKVKLPRCLNCLEDLGNTSSTSHFMVLHKHLAEGTIKPGAKLLIIPVASGIVVGCVSCTISNLKVTS